VSAKKDSSRAGLESDNADGGASDQIIRDRPTASGSWLKSVKSHANREAAHQYAAHGWPVFVLTASKRPVALCRAEACQDHRGDPRASEACQCLTCHGFYAATLDHDRIDAMFDRHPDGLVAIRTGRPSGLVVVDVDPPVGLRTMADST
jgi:hypothetical protein